MFSHAILPWVRKLHVASYTVLIDLGLAELRSVRDSVALRSYADSQSHSDSRARPRKARSYIGQSHGKNACGICSLRLGPRRIPDRSGVGTPHGPGDHAARQRGGRERSLGYGRETQSRGGSLDGIT